jgi:hypothetical protein
MNLSIHEFNSIGTVCNATRISIFRSLFCVDSFLHSITDFNSVCLHTELAAGWIQTHMTTILIPNLHFASLLGSQLIGIIAADHLLAPHHHLLMVCYNLYLPRTRTLDYQDPLPLGTSGLIPKNKIKMVYMLF